MKILITGTNGFVGKRLINRLKQETSYDLHGIDDEYFAAEIWQDSLTSYLYDLDPDVIIHVGADTNTLERRVNYEMSRNHEATKILVDWCAHRRLPFIYSSSAACYGVDGRTSSNLYGWSKYTAENYVTAMGGISLRYFNVYGPGEEHKGNMASFVYQAFLKNQKGEEISLFPGNPRRDFVHVDDVVNANIFALNNYVTLPKKHFDVGSGHACSYERLMDVMGYKYTYCSEDVVPVGYQYYTRSNKQKWLPGWKPCYDIDYGLKTYKKYLTGDEDV